MITFEKPRSFFPSFQRKGSFQSSTTYCPGCGHGIINKFIACAIDELGIQDRTIVLSPVGCSVFLWYYFDTGNVQCSHGRAPAVATGIRRTLNDAIVIGYQGDGDLAGIGTTEIIHAANRGENITVFFVNNAIYGMTGGQMAPTTLLGQTTVTTPDGRSAMRDGGPIGMAEVINALKAPVFITRVSLASPAKILKARAAIKKAIVNQIDKKGFSFVEILSPCPVNWKMKPIDALAWIASTLENEFPVKIFRDVAETAVPVSSQPAHPLLDDAALLDFLNTDETISVPAQTAEFPDQLIKIGGFGGQGVLSAGTALANCAVAEGLNATWLPSYGAEMRGGTANASVIVSRDAIGSPVVDFPNVLLALNGPSLDAFEAAVQPGGMIIVNSSIVSRKVLRDDVTTLYVPASDIAKEENFIPGANTAMLTVYLLASKTVSLETLAAMIPVIITKTEYVEKNVNILRRAQRFYEDSRKRL